MSPLDKDLQHLDQALKEAEQRQGGFSAQTDQARQSRVQHNGAALGIRVIVDLLAGIGVAAAIGWYLDRTFETGPWIMVAMVPLGFVAGILNMVRTARDFEQRAKKMTPKAE